MRMPATSKAGGECLSPPANVCKVPSPSGPVPTPMGSSGSPATASDTCNTVLIEKKPSCTEISRIKTSKLDELGTLGGVMSNTHGDAIQFKKHSPKVYFANKKVVHHTALTSHNGTNANQPMGNHLTASQQKVHVAT